MTAPTPALTPACNMAASEPISSSSSLESERRFFSAISHRIFEIKLRYQKAILENPAVDIKQRVEAASIIQHDLGNWRSSVRAYTNRLTDKIERGKEMPINLTHIIMSVAAFKYRSEISEGMYPDALFIPGFEKGISGINDELVAVLKACHHEKPLPEGNMFSDATVEEDPQAEIDLFQQWLAALPSSPPLDFPME